jgi:hypothetical protein
MATPRQVTGNHRNDRLFKAAAEIIAMTSLCEIELRLGEEAAEGARQKEEPSEWDERDRRQSDDGRSERTRAVSEFQLRRGIGEVISDR